MRTCCDDMTCLISFVICYLIVSCVFTCTFRVYFSFVYLKCNFSGISEECLITCMLSKGLSSCFNTVLFVNVQLLV